MKILFVLNSGFDTPGPSNHLLESIIKKTLQNDYKAHIIEKHKTGKNPDIPLSLENNRNLTFDTINVKNVEKSSFAKRYIADIIYAFTCLKYYMKQKDASVVFLQSCNTAFFQILFLKLVLKKPVLYNVQDIFPLNAMMMGLIQEKSTLHKILNYIQRLAYRMADQIITISDDMKETIVNEGVLDNKISVIHNWSYSDEIIEIHDKDNKFISDNGIDDTHYKIVYAGNIGTMQNVEVILSAANILKGEKNIRFYIVGEGVKKRKYMEFAQKNDLQNVFFYPMQSSEYAPHIYSMADVNLITLNKGIIKTALPSKTATCLSCGKPIIAVIDRESHFAKMISECDNCSVIDSDDAKGLANSILYYYNNSIKSRSFGERELFKNSFSKEKNSGLYFNILKQLAKKK